MSTERSRSKHGESIRLIQQGLRSLTQQLHRLNDAVGARVELLPGDLEVLDMLGRDGPMSPRDITAKTGIHPATLTGVLDRLESGGWLTRQPDPDDRRRVIVEAILDRAGELMRLYGPMNKSISTICADYSPDELAAIGEFLQRTSEAGIEATKDVKGGR